MASLFPLLTYISTQVSPLLLLCAHILLPGLVFFLGGLPTIASFHLFVVMDRALCLLTHQVIPSLVWFGLKSQRRKKIRIGPYEPHLLS